MNPDELTAEEMAEARQPLPNSAKEWLEDYRARRTAAEREALIALQTAIAELAEKEAA